MPAVDLSKMTEKEKQEYLAEQVNSCIASSVYYDIFLLQEMKAYGWDGKEKNGAAESFSALSAMCDAESAKAAGKEIAQKVRH